jgi:hypothetical protein
MGNTVLGLLAALFAVAGGLYYIYTIVRGNTRPQRITWLVWTLIGVLGAGSAIQGGAGPGAYITLVYLGLEVAILILSLVKYGKPGKEPYDYPLTAVAIISILVWWLADLPAAFAATIAIFADSIGLWFTLRESWRQPETESLLAWAFDIPAAILAIAASAKFSYGAIGYLVYFFVGNSVMVGVLLIRRNQPIQQKG